VKKNIGLERHSQRRSLVIDTNYLLGEAHGLPEDHLPLWAVLQRQASSYKDSDYGG
jgi:hypothetical protein